jgi:ribonuclease P protein component
LLAPDFKRVFAHAIRLRDSYFTVLATSTNGCDARLGLAVSKRHVKRAVDRNRLKRIVREVFRHRREQLKGIDIVVMVGPSVLRAENAQLSGSISRHLDRLVAKFQPLILE